MTGAHYCSLKVEKTGIVFVDFEAVAKLLPHFKGIFSASSVGALEFAMSANVQKFDKRLSRIVRKHRSMSEGYDFRLERNGLITIKPKRAKGTAPLTVLFSVLLIGLLFKAVVLAHLGPDKYAAKLEPMKNGTIVEQAAAWIMEPGIMTQYVSRAVVDIIR